MSRCTWWPGGKMLRSVLWPVRASELLRVLLTGLLLVLLTPVLASTDEHATPNLEGRRLCVDPTSVVIQLEGLGQSRATSVRPKLSKQLDRLLKRSLAEGGLDYRIAASCRASDGFVTLDARITVLDPVVYRRQGPQAFGYALELQVGDHAEQSSRREHPLLLNQRFEAFDEDVYSEASNRVRIEAYLEARAQALFDALVEAWQLDNP